MRTKLKRTGILLLCILFVAASTGAKPKLVSEVEAKEAGLALINQVFGVTETEATVTLSERESFSYINGEEQTTGKEEKALIYVVSVPGKGVKATQYQAEVNAKTGVAFRASMNSYFLPAMTEEQRKLNGNPSKKFRKIRRKDGRKAMKQSGEPFRLMLKLMCRM